MASSLEFCRKTLIFGGPLFRDHVHQSEIEVFSAFRRYEWIAEFSEHNGLPATHSLAGTGVMIGTPEYMSPEQVERREVEPVTCGD
jgi:hypothetical protein